MATSKEAKVGLLSKLFGGGGADDVSAPESVECAGSINTIYAPATGNVVLMADIPDPVFASGAMGPAIGVKPTSGVVYAPVTGEVTVTTGTLHALALMSDGGIELLIHVGVDTVNMKGDGFCGFVEKGRRVRAGDALVTMDLDKIAEAGYDDTVITVVTNADDFASIEPVDAGSVRAGEALMTVASE